MEHLYAHTKEDKQTKQPLPESEWQTLKEHLDAVAQLAAEFAAQFGREQMGYAAGLLHDIGKANPAFQRRLRGGQAVDHKSEGARIAQERYGTAFGKLLAYAIYGHHNGLPDDVAADSANGLSETLAQPSVYQGGLLSDLPQPADMRGKQLSARGHSGMTLSLLIRMLFSCLVDGDYLDTEGFKEPERHQARGSFADIEEICRRFAAAQAQLLSKQQDTVVARARHSVLTECLEAAKEAPGLFSLTVPTGGGKTLSSLAFALEHARLHGKARVIYAIPYTSIIEQNAAVFRDILGEDAVLEHHSNVINEYQGGDDSFDLSRLASENWQAALIVTTNVQLFESLFACKPARARKLHQLANAVIILDEAQMLPDNLLLPCLSALQCLCEDYGATVLFCTATQPAFKPAWFGGLALREIIRDPAALYQQLRRNTVHMLGRLDEEALLERLRQHEQALCIVNTRQEARRLYLLTGGGEHVFHLSALMCAEHRTQALARIRHRLKKKLPCLVISTQLIEAGVDLDFPVVYRAIGGVDSIAQAAGRCNREGLLENGLVYVFEPARGLPPGQFSRLASFTRQVLQLHKNPLELAAVREYFQLRYMSEDELDEHKLLPSLDRGAGRASFQFREIAEAFRFIDSPMVDVIIPYDEAVRATLTEAQHSAYPASYARRLQRYCVSVYPYELEELRGRGYISTGIPGMYVLSAGDTGFNTVYSRDYGLNVKPQHDLLFT